MVALRNLPLFAALILFLPTFSAMKGSIFRFNDYGWDETFIRWDHALHGTDPWLLLQPVLGFPIVTYAISIAYHFWLILIYVAVLAIQFNCKNPQLREQFFIGFFLCWGLIGSGLAILFASVGPCFVEPILGLDRFAAQTSYLKSVEAHYPILVNDVQQLLLERYQNRSAELGAGITAMPSMHVAFACLLWLTSRKLSRLWGYAGFAFLAIILLGSVHLSWHYAVDGYVSIVVMVVLWKLSGWFLRKQGEELHPQNSGSSTAIAAH